MEYYEIIVKDKVTGKEYSNPYDLIDDIESLNQHACLFDNSEFAWTDQKRLVIIGNCNDVVDLPEDRFEIIQMPLGNGVYLNKKENNWLLINKRK
jgi:hypothetical protein